MTARKSRLPKCLLLALLITAQPGAGSARTAARAGAEGEGKAGRPVSAGDFSLTDQDGRPFRLSQLRGKIVLLFFGYTSCPDACPTTLAKLSKVYRLLGADAKDVVTLFVSVDPGRDKPRVLKGYLKYFRVNSVGLTGTKEEIDAVVAAYGARYEIEESDSAGGYHVSHSTDLYLIDRKGELAHSFKYADTTRAIAEGVKRLI